MDPKELKKILGRIGLAGLITAGSVTLTGCAHHGKSSCSSCSGKKAEKQVEEGKTSCSGGAAKEGKTSCSGGTSCG